MNERLSIVTAFYDIKRAEVKGFERSNSKYLNWFSFWAGLQNELIVYTSAEFKDEILKIRKDRGLEHKTKIVVKEMESFDKFALYKIKQTFENYNQSFGRAKPNDIQCVNLWYCYLIYLKPFFVCDAIERNLASDEILWLDFGFNHGDEYFSDSRQFNFSLEASGGGF